MPVILLMPPSKTPTDELDLVYGNNPFKDKIGYAYVPEGKKGAPRAFYDFDGSRMQAHSDLKDLGRTLVGMEVKGRKWSESGRIPQAIKERMLLGDGASVKASVRAFDVYYKRREPMASPFPEDKLLTLRITPEQNLFIWKNEETGEVVEEECNDVEYGSAS